MTAICESPSSLFLRNSQQLKPIVPKLSRLDVNSTESNNRKTVITSKTKNKGIQAFIHIHIKNYNIGMTITLYQNQTYLHEI